MPSRALPLALLVIVIAAAPYTQAQWREVASTPLSDRLYISQISPDGALVALGTAKSLLLWDVTKPSSAPQLKNENDVESLAFANRSPEIALGYADGSVIIKDRTLTKEIARIKATSKVTEIAFSPDDKVLALVIANNRLRFWRRDSGLSDVEIRPAFGGLMPNSAIPGVAGVAFSPDGSLFAMAMNDTNVYIIDAVKNTLRKTIDELALSPFTLAFSPDGKLLYVGGANKKVQAFETQTWKVAREFPRQPELVTQLALSPDGRRLALHKQKEVSLRQPAPVQVWDISGAKPREIGHHERRPGSTIRFTHSGELLFTQWDGAVLRVFAMK